MRENLLVKFGKLNDPEDLAHVDFALPSLSARSEALLADRTKGRSLQVFVGLPMWGNKDWVGKLYPPKTKAGDFLTHYARIFNGIELNSTHYRTPNPETVARWRDSASDGFHFSPKVLQAISHRYQLVNCQDLVDRFTGAIKGFEEKLGCSFVQLPPHFSPDRKANLEWFLGASWPADIPLAIEFRHESWFSDQQLSSDTLDLLEATGTSAVITDVAGRRDVLHDHLTTTTAMIRFVGNGLLPSDYARADAWIQRLGVWVEKGLERLYFFVHEPNDAFAPEMGAYVIRRLNETFDLKLTEPVLYSDKGPQLSLF